MANEAGGRLAHAEFDGTLDAADASRADAQAQVAYTELNGVVSTQAIARLRRQDVPKGRLSDLADVVTVDLAEGHVLVWDDAEGSWISRDLDARLSAAIDENPQPGPTGPQGEPGPQGIQGPPGVDGQPGERGERGPSGPQGLPGEPGPAGPPGPQGEPGPIGPFGPQGETGAQGETGPAGERGEPGQVGRDGADGRSAYELAVDEGFAGTLDDWLASLVGPAGPEGPPGEPGAQGEDGLSAYEIALSNGFHGSEAEWLKSLVGERGHSGAPGPRGYPGPQGPPGPGGGGSGGDLSYLHDQSTPATTWVIVHNLGKYPSTTVVDSGGSVVYGDVVHVDDTQLTISFSAGFSGRAFIN